MKLELGTEVRCEDGPCGELADIVIDPLRRHVTYLVVQPRHRHALARLVPIKLAAARRDGSQSVLTLECTTEEVRRLDPVQEVAFLRLWRDELPSEDPNWDVGIGEVLAPPYYRTGDPYDGFPGEYDAPISITYDRVPRGEIEIRRASAVTSADGRHVGLVDGLLVDDGDQITHVVLDRGHLLRARAQEVTIPIGDVARVKSDSVELRLSKDAVEELPAVPVHRRYMRHPHADVTF